MTGRFRFTPVCCCGGEEPITCFEPCYTECGKVFEGYYAKTTTRSGSEIDDSSFVSFNVLNSFLLCTENPTYRYFRLSTAFSSLGYYVVAEPRVSVEENYGGSILDVYECSLSTNILKTTGTCTYNSTNTKETVYVFKQRGNNKNPIRTVTYDSYYHCYNFTNSPKIQSSRWDYGYPITIKYLISYSLPVDHEFCFTVESLTQENWINAPTVRLTPEGGEVPTQGSINYPDYYKTKEDCGTYPVEYCSSSSYSFDDVVSASELEDLIDSNISSSHYSGRDYFRIMLVGFTNEHGHVEQTGGNVGGYYDGFRIKLLCVCCAEKLNGQGESEPYAIILDNQSIKNISVNGDNFDDLFNNTGHPDYPDDLLYYSGTDSENIESSGIWYVGDSVPLPDNSNMTDSQTGSEIGSGGSIPCRWRNFSTSTYRSITGRGNNNCVSMNGVSWIYATAAPCNEDFKISATLHGSFRNFPIGRFSFDLSQKDMGYYSPLTTMIAPPPLLSVPLVLDKSSGSFSIEDFEKEYVEINGWTATQSGETEEHYRNRASIKKVFECRYNTGSGTPNSFGKKYFNTLEEDSISSITYYPEQLGIVPIPAGKEIVKFVWRCFCDDLNFVYDVQEPTSINNLTKATYPNSSYYFLPLFNVNENILSMSYGSRNWSKFPYDWFRDVYINTDSLTVFPYNETNINLKKVGSLQPALLEGYAEANNYDLCKKTICGNEYKEFTINGKRYFMPKITDSQALRMTGSIGGSSIKLGMNNSTISGYISKGVINDNGLCYIKKDIEFFVLFKDVE